MRALSSLRWITPALLPLLSGCGDLADLFRTEGTTSAGRGPEYFDPYIGSVSPAVRLSLQTFNGCAIAPWGEGWSRGAMNIPYPDGNDGTQPEACDNITMPNPGTGPKRTPTRPMPLLAGTTYFLNQITLAQMLVDVHRDMSQLTQPLEWMERQSIFKDLDWSGASILHDEWIATRADGAWERVVWYGGAQWMLETEDSFTLEVHRVDTAMMPQTDTIVVAPHEYKRTDFLVENPVGGHTVFGWSADMIGAPQFPGDNVLHDPRPARPGFSGASPKAFRTIARFEATVATNPYRTFTLPPDLTGQGYIKLTWSLLPDRPFYWPIEFVQPADVAPTCFSEEEPPQPVPCSFGIWPEVHFTEPANGSFYQPGETLEFSIHFHDGQGNMLHPEDEMYSYDEGMRGAANGLLYYFSNSRSLYREQDIGSMFKVSGPLQKLRVPYEPAFLEHYDRFEYPTGRGYLPNDGVIGYTALGTRSVRGPTRIPVRLPDDAEPGTWVVMVKANRFWMGERQTKTNPAYFQVGQLEKTKYPQRVGNCQICHIGPLNLENIQMAVPEDDTEGCVICHGPGPAQEVHRTHTLSRKWPRERRDCVTCHLTRESALRPSLWVCATCHPEPHGAKYWQEQITSYNWSPEPNVLSNCAPSCHMETAPTAHILPER